MPRLGQALKAIEDIPGRHTPAPVDSAQPAHEGDVGDNPSTHPSTSADVEMGTDLPSTGVGPTFIPYTALQPQDLLDQHTVVYFPHLTLITYCRTDASTKVDDLLQAEHDLGSDDVLTAYSILGTRFWQVIWFTTGNAWSYNHKTFPPQDLM